MDPVGFAVGIVSLIPIIIKGGDYLIIKYKSFRDSEPEIDEWILKIETEWIRLRYQIKFLGSIWLSLEEEFQAHQNKILQVLHGKLQQAIVIADGLHESEQKQSLGQQNFRKISTIKKLKYATLVKDRLSATIEDLKNWGNLFNPSWFLLLRLSDQNVEHKLIEKTLDESESIKTMRALRKAIQAITQEQFASQQGNTTRSSIFLDSKAVNLKDSEIPFSSARICRADGNFSAIIDSSSQNSTFRDTSSTKDVRDIARLLQRVDPLTFGLLKCRGVIKSDNSPPAGSTYQFLFDIPSGFSCPMSLRHLLIQGLAMQTLNDRFELARQLCRSCLFLHSTKFVHKNIRPDKILVFQGEDSCYKWPFLVGFEHFRMLDGNTALFGDDLWERNIYRHPTRQGVRPEEVYIMQHDIYSLGVCLLEIGLSKSFVKPSEEDTHNDVASVIARKDLRQIILETGVKDQHKTARAVKNYFASLAQKELPSSMGRRYTDIVLACLTCLDRQENLFGKENDLDDEDGILVGVRYIEKVLLAIGEIQV